MITVTPCGAKGRRSEDRLYAGAKNKHPFNLGTVRVSTIPSLAGLDVKEAKDKEPLLGVVRDLLIMKKKIVE